ncbi:Group II decarboxylase family protein [uncultured Candidatus Thioglobus sp.]|nr:Group II decarboxylase family protein [uncultured Candidatus Thioglobus sp.]
MQESELLTKIAQTLQSTSLKKTNQLINHQNPDALEKALDLSAKTPQSFEALFDWVEKYLEYSPNTSHPNFANRMWSGANPPSIVGEIITALSNTSGCTFESAPVATLMEAYMLEQMLDIVGFKQGEGQMTTGSSNANMIAMMVARNQTLKNAKQQGLFSQQPLFAFVSTDAHYSLDKAVNILGIGTEHLIKIPTLDNGQMDSTALDKAIESVVKNGGIAFFVCATLGTTVRGAYDSIEDLLKLRDKYGFWLHGDGAWGGAAIMSEPLKQQFLFGLEKIDSFTMDFHKMLGSNLMCNFLLLNYQNLLSCTCADGDNSYIFREKQLDLGVASLQCGRRVDSLKWFLDWKFYAKIGFAQRVENYHRLASFTEDFIKQTDALEMVVARSSFNVCFRFKSEDANVFNQKLRDKLLLDEQALLALAYIGEKLVFRLLISNINFDEVKLSSLLKRLIKTGIELQHNA